MSKKEQDIELLDELLNNNLSIEEVNELKERLKKDDSLRALYDELIILREGVAYSKRKELLEKLKAVEDDLQSNLNKTKKPIVKHLGWYWLAASIIALLFISSLVLNLFTSNANELYLAYYTPYPNLEYPIQRNSTTTIQETEKAYQAYERKEYQNARDLFLSNPVEKDDGYFFYLGNTYMALEEYDKAISVYNQVLEMPSSSYLQQSLWFKGLALLKQEKTEMAIEVFKQLSQKKIYLFK